MIQSYRWRDGEEAVLSFGEAGWPVLLVLQPLFEEANRARSVLAQSMRLLASEFGIASVLPDLPGTGDSLVPSESARLENWTEAVRSVSEACGACMTLSVRGGTLLDHAAGVQHNWRLAPETGSRLLRDMVRATALTSGSTASVLAEQALREPTRLAGTMINPALYTALDQAKPAEVRHLRTVRLGDGAEPADHRADAVPVWRRAEPTSDAALVSLITQDVADWMTQCGVR